MFQVLVFLSHWVQPMLLTSHSQSSCLLNIGTSGTRNGEFSQDALLFRNQRCGPLSHILTFKTVLALLTVSLSLSAFPVDQLFAFSTMFTWIAVRWRWKAAMQRFVFIFNFVLCYGDFKKALFQGKRKWVCCGVCGVVCPCKKCRKGSCGLGLRFLSVLSLSLSFFFLLSLPVSLLVSVFLVRLSSVLTVCRVLGYPTHEALSVSNVVIALQAAACWESRPN